jgi:hypothetical protein
MNSSNVCAKAYEQQTCQLEDKAGLSCSARASSPNAQRAGYEAASRFKTERPAPENQQMVPNYWGFTGESKAERQRKSVAA